MKLPVLMDRDFCYLRVLHPSKLALNLELLALGTAQLELPDGEMSVGYRQWVEMQLPGGAKVIYRAGTLPITCGKEQRVKLSHGIVTLDDELTPADTTLTGTPQQILTTLLGYQRTVRWQLGTAPNTGTYTLEVNKTRVLRAYWDALALFYGYAPSYDFTTTPWTVSLTALSETPTCECRLSRNIASATIDYDDADFCTRVCAPQLPSGHLIADTASLWGEVSRDLGVADDAPAADVTAYAQRYLAAHKNPALYAEVDALDIAAQTGETLDELRLGKVCRCALPDYGTTVNAPIISMRWGDLVQKPESVRLSLGKKIKDASLKLAEVDKSTDDNGRGLRSAGAGMRKNATTLIEQGDSLITLSAWKVTAENALNEAAIRIDGANAAIQLKASQTEVDGLTSRMSEAEINIDGANAAIELKVSKNGVVSSINQTPEEIKIKAARINLSGYVTASQLSATQADIDNLRSGYTTAQVLRATYGYFSSLRIAEQKVSLEQKTVLSGVTFPTFASKIIYYKDASGATQSQQVLTGISTAGSASSFTRYFVTKE